MLCTDAGCPRRTVRVTLDHVPVRADREPDEAATAAADTDTVIAGHRVVRLLGSGERAEVYLGHSGAGSAVALKVFRIDTAAASIELDIAVLTSAAAPGLVRLLDVAQLGDGRICLVLERLAGGSLARYLVEHPQLSPGEVVTLLAPVTVALDAMHTAGFAHGNVSQATILLDTNGRAVLTGFGAVRRFSDVPRERMQLLRGDYSRLEIVVHTLWDALDESISGREGESLPIRRFEAAVDPTHVRSDSALADGGAGRGSVLRALEHDLFDWADALPLRGFHVALQQDANAQAVNSPATQERPRSVDSVRLRQAFGTGGGSSGSKRYPADRDEAERDDADFNDADVHAGDVDSASIFDVATESRNDLGDDSGHGIAGGLANRVPSSIFGRTSDGLREFFGRETVHVRGLHDRARLGRALESAVDFHPLTAAGHALRKRLHGRRRPLLVAVLGCISILVVGPTLFPVSGRAGEAGRSSQSGESASARSPGPSTPPVPSSTTDRPPVTGELPAGSATDTEKGSGPGPADAGTADQSVIAGDDPVAAVPALLARRATCLAAASLVCLVAVDQTGSAILALDSYDARERQQGGPGRELPDYGDYFPSLAERNGDLAVVALTPTPGQQKSQPASVLVVKGEDGWRLREIFDY